MVIGFFVPGGHAAAGWTGYAPLSSDAQWTGVDWGQNLWAISLLIQGFSSLVGSINYITTIINMRAPGDDVLPVTFGYLVTFHRGHSFIARISRTYRPHSRSSSLIDLPEPLSLRQQPKAAATHSCGSTSSGSSDTQKSISLFCQAWASLRS